MVPQIITNCGYFKLDFKKLVFCLTTPLWELFKCNEDLKREPLSIGLVLCVVDLDLLAPASLHTKSAAFPMHVLN